MDDRENRDFRSQMVCLGGFSAWSFFLFPEAEKLALFSLNYWLEKSVLVALLED